jgi:hypothetical protein
LASYKENFADGKLKAEEAVREMKRTQFPGIIAKEYHSINNPDVKNSFLWHIAEYIIQK